MMNLSQRSRTGLSRFFGMLLISACAAVSTPALAGFTEPPAEVKAVIPAAVKMGEGRLRWWGFHVYDGQLWSETAPTAFDYKTSAHWLQLKYARDFEGAKIAEKSREEMQEQGLGPEVKLNAWQEKLASIFPDVKKGDTLSAFFVPGKTALFFHNGKKVAELADQDLAAAFMGIWLDPKTSAPEMRLELIGLKR